MAMPAPTSAAQDSERRFLLAFFHDLAAALSGVSLQVELAHRRSARGEDPSGAVAEAHGALSRTLELFEAGRELLIRGPAEAETFAFDAWVEEASRAAGVADVLGSTEGLVSGDRARLTAALQALLTNAVEASSPAETTVKREGAGDVLRVAIENPGRLAESDVERLFSPRAAREGRSWGFGLPAARLYAGEAGGRVTIAQAGPRVAATLELPQVRP
jgi:anti-sigma regulatory factor (Ser/Thr protein kinase)